MFFVSKPVSFSLELDEMVVSTTNTNNVADGLINRDYWTGINGSRLTNLTNQANYPNTPTNSDLLGGGMEALGWAGSANVGGYERYGDNYGQRLYGYIIPQTTGDYTFWIASDDDSEFSLSTSSSPSGTIRTCWINGWTQPHNYSVVSGEIGGSKQKSSSIHLVAGQAYYFELLQKEGYGGDHVSVAWSTNSSINPSSTNIIPASVLSSSVAGSGVISDGKINRDYWTGIGGSRLTDLTNHANYPNTPTNSDLLGSGLEALGWAGSANAGGYERYGDNYGQRLYGYIIPVATGDYTFWIASDDDSELSLSTTSSAAAMSRICWINGWTQAA